MLRERLTTAEWGMDHLPSPAGSALPNVAQEALCFSCHNATQTFLIQNLSGYLFSLIWDSQLTLRIYADANKIRIYCLRIIKSSFKPGVIFYLEVPNQYRVISC